jgi:hypothetical protein
MRNTRRTGLALLMCLFVAMVLTACGGSATNTPVPAPATTAAPAATTAPAVATTAAISATTAAPTRAATTAAVSATTASTSTGTSGQGYQLSLSGFTRIEIPAQITKLLLQSLPQIANINPQVSLYVSDATDAAKAATDVDAELKKAGYAYALPGGTAPVTQGTQSVGAYTKSGSADILFTSAPIDASQFSPASLQQVGISDAEIQKIQTAVQGKKIAATFISANGLLNTLIGGATGSTTPAASAATTAPARATTAAISATTAATSATTAASGSTGSAVDTFTQIDIPKQLSDPIIAALPIKSVQNPQIAFFVSPAADLAKGADLIDAEFKSQGYKFGYPGVTKPVASGSFYVSAYTKDATSPEVFILVATPQSLNFDKVTAQALVALGATPADAQKFEDGVKSAKSVAMFIYAPGLIKALGGS